MLNYFKIQYDLFKEKARRFIHPKIYRENQVLFKNRQKFYSTFLSPHDLVYDVGANLGNRVEIFLSLKNRVIAIEPQIYCFNYLKVKFGKTVTLLKVALGSKKGKMKMYINSGSSTLSSLSKDWIDAMKSSRFKDTDWNKTIEVEVDTLDSLLATHGTPHFIKIDVEGFEPEVLKGLTKPVPIISFEYTTPEQTKKLHECLKLIESISDKYLCNYSAGEKACFALKEWATLDNFTGMITKDVSILEGFGDIYVKLPDCKIN